MIVPLLGLNHTKSSYSSGSAFLVICLDDSALLASQMYRTWSYENSCRSSICILPDLCSQFHNLYIILSVLIDGVNLLIQRICRKRSGERECFGLFFLHLQTTFKAIFCAEFLFRCVAEKMNVLLRHAPPPRCRVAPPAAGPRS